MAAHDLALPPVSTTSAALATDGSVLQDQETVVI